MPRRKYDEWDMINRTYPVKCKKCKEYIFIDYEIFDCPHCGCVMCPDCLADISSSSATHESYNSSPYGASLQVTCRNCSYDIVDTDIY